MGRGAVVRCAACDTPLCADCASQIVQPGAPPDAAACPPCASTYGVASSVPFENAAHAGWTAYWKTFGLAIGRPSALWKSFPARGTGTAVSFAYLAALPALLVNAGGAFCGVAMQRFGGGAAQSSGIPAVDQWRAYAQSPEVLWMNLGLLGLLFGATPLIALLWAALHHIPAAMGGARHGFRATFRAVCYLTPLAILSMACFPVSTLPVWVWHSVVMTGAMRRIHGLHGGAAVMAGLLPTLVFGALCCAGFAVAMMVLMATLQGVAG